MSKCAFKNCKNYNPKPGIYFYSFKDVAQPVSNQWVRIVARERCDPNYKPTATSRICSEHFAPYEITPTKKLYRTAIPTINIGPYDDVVIIPDEEKFISEDSDIVCIIENQISTQPIISEDEDIVCVIENQISTEPQPQKTNEQEIDIEEQIQWSLVGTSRHFEGLLNTRGLKRLEKTPPQQTIKKQKGNCVNKVVVEVDKGHDDSETESEDEFKNLYSQDEIDKKFNDQYSEFLRTYNKEKWNKLKSKVTRKKWDRDKVTQIRETSPTLSKQFATTSQEHNIPIDQTTNRFLSPMLRTVPTNQNETLTTMQQLIPLAPTKLYKTTTEQPVPTTPKQFVTTTQQPVLTAPNQFETRSQQTIPTAPKQFITPTEQPVPLALIETTTQPMPIHLVKSPQVTKIPQFTTIPQLATMPQLTTIPQLATISQNMTPLYVQASTSQNGTTQLTPPHLSNVQFCGVFLEENNVRTYYILPTSTKLVTESDPNGEVIVPGQCLNLNDKTSATNFLTKCGDNNEQFQPVIVKTENISTLETNFLTKSGENSEQFQPVIVKTENISDY